MRLDFALLGVPLIDGFWIGSIAVALGDNVMCAELGTDPLVGASWRVYRRSQIWIDGDIAYAVRGEMVDVGAVLASWKLRQCSKRELFLFGTANSRELLAPSRPRAPMAGAQARVA